MSTFQPSSRIDGATSQLRWSTSYAAIPRPLLRDPSFAKLKGNAVKLLMAMLSGYVGNNNGELIATFPVMKAYGFNSKDAVAKALKELLQAGMIIRTRQSDYRRAATYAVTWLPVNKPGLRGPYDAGVSPTEAAEDRWRLSAVHASVAASGPAPTASAAPPATTGSSLLAPGPTAAPVASKPEEESDPAASVTSAPEPTLEAARTPHAATLPTHEPLATARARWPAMKARWDARVAAAQRLREERMETSSSARATLDVPVLDQQLPVDPGGRLSA